MSGPLHASRRFAGLIAASALVSSLVLPGASRSSNPASASEETEQVEAARASGLSSQREELRLDRNFFRSIPLWLDGQTTFRHRTLGSESFFTDAIGLNEAVTGLPPVAALGLGLKVDRDALPRSLQRALARGEVDLEDPAVTVALVELGAVVGVEGEVAGGAVTELGITCALCHSTVDDSFAPGIGRRVDGWANRDLDVGSILGAAPRLQPIADLLSVPVETVRLVLASWGPGRFDAHLNLDGRAFRPDGETAAVLIPPAFGLAGVNLHTYTGWGSVSYWNAFVGNLEMNGQGRFYDPRLEDAAKFPIAAANGFGDQSSEPDRITPHLPGLHFYQLSIQAPPAPRGRYDERAARRGEALFNGEARCSTCHVPPLYTEPGWNLHAPEEIGIDDFQASRSPDEKYRTTPLRGLWTHEKGGFYHDGRFSTLEEVVAHYDAHFSLALSDAEAADLVEFLRSL